MATPWTATLRLRNKPAAATFSAPRDLSEARPGQDVLVTGYGNLPPAEKNHLQAYGLVPGRRIRVLQHSPVTVVLIEQTELAFEREVAQEVLVSVSESARP